MKFVPDVCVMRVRRVGQALFWERFDNGDGS